MRTYYINLDSQPERKTRIDRQLGLLGLEATRIRAVTPADIPAETLRKYASPRRYRPLAAAEVACTFSHMEALRQVAAGRDRYALVLEDDAILSRGLADFLKDIDRATDEFDLIKLDSVGDAVYVTTRGNPTFGAITLRRVLNRRSCLTGYVISRGAAAKLAWNEQLLREAVDDSIFNPASPIARQLRMWHADPALCAQPEYLGAWASDSTIKEELRSRPAATRTLLQKVTFGAKDFVERELLIGLPKTIARATGAATKKRIAVLAAGDRLA